MPEGKEEEEKELTELEEVEEGLKLPIGFRIWRMSFKGGEPRLGSLGGVPWEPEVEYSKDPITGEEVPVVIVKSDWPGEEKAPWDKTSHGLYMLKSPEELKKQFSEGELHGQVLPYGRIREGPIGYRAQKAKVSALGKWKVTCYICGEPARYYIHDDKTYALCEKHLKLLENKIKGRNYSTEEVEVIIRRLADIYEADILYEEP